MRTPIWLLAFAFTTSLIGAAQMARRGNVARIVIPPYDRSLDAEEWMPHHLATPVFLTTFQDKTNQSGNAAFPKRSEVLQRIRIGYQKMLRLRKEDGSFAWPQRKSNWLKAFFVKLFWGAPNTNSSSWLTANMVKILTRANTLVTVQRDMICSAVRFLINAQDPNGKIREDGPLNDHWKEGGVRAKNAGTSFTAFCLIAMQESRTLCAATVDRLPGSIDKAVAYLGGQLPLLTDVYAVAITSYALANEGKLDRDILFKFASPELNHWPVPEASWSYWFTREATAYALLALVKAQAFEEARPVERWLALQSLPGHNQAVVIRYQALAEYWAAAKEPEYDLNVEILLPDRNNYAPRTSTVRTHTVILHVAFSIFVMVYL